MSSNNQKYSVGSIALAEPYFDYVHTLPLVTFSDVKNTVELALVYNSQIATDDYFNIADGYKFNLQKMLEFDQQSGQVLYLVDANGLKVVCNPATNQTASSASVYALNDDSHRILRRITSGFELEYPDYSKEYFNSDGKQTSSFDKYGEEIFRFSYSNGLLSTIEYRPEVGADYKKFEFDYSSNRLTTITYSANGTPLTIGTFSLASNGFDIQHYSGVKYHLRKAGNEYIAYSTITNTSGGQTTVHRVDCTKTGNTYETGVNKWNTDKRIKTFQNVVSGVSSDGTSKSVTTTNTFDKKLRLTKKTNTLGGLAYSKEISYNKTRVSNVYDSLKITGDDNTNTIGSFGYTYDDLGRIVGETDSDAGTSKSYVCDMAGRLVRENNSALNKTHTYEYDNVGNVTNRKTYAYTTGDLPSSASTTDTLSYSTTHPDRLTSFGGKAITYDQQGCPLTYDGKTYTWTRGRLTKIALGVDVSRAITPIVPTLSSERWEYTYNGNGQRTKKKYTYIPPSSGSIIAGVLTDETVDYTYDHSGRLVQEKTTREFTSGSDSTWTITYLYDCNTIVGMVLNGATYYFHRNIQGDVVGVYDSTGAKVVGFKYDAFGRCTVSGNTTLAQWCKIRYRGYYFDNETGLYWVQTRYYNPEWCRWISPDSIGYLDPESAHGLNLYAYCINDPVNYIDPSGHGIIVAIAAIILGTTLGGAIFGGVSAASAGGDTEEILEGIGKGAFNGFLLGTSASLIVGGIWLGCTSVAGAAMASYGMSVFTNWTEVAILQSKKSFSEGDSFLEGVHDMTNALYANKAGILLGMQQVAGIDMYGTSVASKSWTLLKVGMMYKSGALNFKTILGSPIGALGAFASAASAVASLIRILRALVTGENSRGWILY